jgi:hypothetical protein
MDLAFRLAHSDQFDHVMAYAKKIWEWQSPGQFPEAFNAIRSGQSHDMS